jgi:hypothetical protein
VMKSRSLKWTPKERGEILDFIRKVVPTRWNVITSYEHYRDEKGILNLLVTVTDYDADNSRNYKYNARVVGEVEYFNGAGITQMEVYYMVRNWRYVVLHELAHVAVHRYLAFVNKLHLLPKGDSACIMLDSGFQGYEVGIPDPKYAMIASELPIMDKVTAHGKYHKRAYKTMVQRAAKKGLKLRRIDKLSTT